MCPDDSRDVRRNDRDLGDISEKSQTACVVEGHSAESYR